MGKYYFMSGPRTVNSAYSQLSSEKQGLVDNQVIKEEKEIVSKIKTKQALKGEYRPVMNTKDGSVKLAGLEYARTLEKNGTHKIAGDTKSGTNY